MKPIELDVLCVGHACYDLVFSVGHHPAADEKTVATAFTSGGGGPAANAAVTAADLGYRSGFAGYLGHDVFGDRHLEELRKQGVFTGLIVRGSLPTPLSTIWVKPDGQRALVNYRGESKPLAPHRIDFENTRCRVILFDGHEPELSQPLAEKAKQNKIPTILDAGSVHPGTRSLIHHVDYLVASQTFAHDFTGADNDQSALSALSRETPNVVITLGSRGLIWKRGNERGALKAFPVDVIDTTGAGDAFHGAFAAATAAGDRWLNRLHFASAVGALCCTVRGARAGIPSREQVRRFLKTQTGVKPLSHQAGKGNGFQTGG